MHEFMAQRLADRDRLTEMAEQLVARAATEERTLSDSETRTLEGWAEECQKIDADLRTVDAQVESQRAYALLRDRLADHSGSNGQDNGRVTSGVGKPAAPVEQRSAAEVFIESPQWRSYPGHGQSGRVELEHFLETRTVITTANLAIPHFVWTPIEQQFKPSILGVVNHVTVSAGVVDWVEIGPDPVAVVTAESSAKTEATITFTPKTASLDTIAHWFQATRQALDDAAYLRGLLEGKLRRGLLAKLEADMAAAIDAAPTLTASTSAAAQGTLLKSIRVGIGKVEAAGYAPNAVLLNPTDYATLDIDVMGTTDSGPVRPATFWGMTPVASNSITAGKAYVGDFQSGATLFDRGVTSVFVTDSHASLFISNVLVILAEARAKSVVDEPNAICECTLAA
jgi:HK97 family phage major capsid protein